MYRTGDGGRQQLLEVVPERELVTRDQEGGPEEQRPPQAQERLIRQHVPPRCKPLFPHRLDYERISELVMSCRAPNLGSLGWARLTSLWPVTSPALLAFSEVLRLV